MVGRLSLASTLLAVAVSAAAHAPATLAQPAERDEAFTRILNRMYNWDREGSAALLADYTRVNPDDPLGWSLTAGALLFGEFDRLHILEMQFFEDDDAIVDKRPLKPDPDVREQIDRAIAQARNRAEGRLRADPGDRDALLAMCMISNVIADYAAFVERRQWRGASLVRQSVVYANKLVSLSPPVYDAYYTTGTLEYVVGSLPFFIRWFVHYDRIDGDKRRGIDNLKLVAARGRIYAPLARLLLAVVSLREGKLDDAQQILKAMSAEYPENPLIKRELARVTARIAERRR